MEITNKMPIDTENLTPMMKQYVQMKSEFPDTLVFYRLGDFYELFFDDARKVSDLLDLTLTRKGNNNGEPIPMAGIPYHAIDGYLARLIKLGQSAVICEQEPDPSGKKLMVRKISKIVTPGTVTDEGIAPETSDNLIGCIYKGKTYYAYASLSLNSGQFTTAISASAKSIKLYIDKSSPVELLYPEGFRETELFSDIACTKRIAQWNFDLESCYKALCSQFATNSLFGFGIENIDECIAVSGALLTYVKSTQNVSLQHVRTIVRDEFTQYVILDKCAQKNLELITNLRGQTAGSLLSVLDKTVTQMGARLIKKWIVEPLRDNEAVQRRLDTLEQLLGNFPRDELHDLLSSIGDIERIVARIALGSSRPKDFAILRDALCILPQIKELLTEHGGRALQEINDKIYTLDEIKNLLKVAIASVPSTFLRDGFVIADGYDKELDTLRDLMAGSENIIKQIEEREREATGISTLKVNFNQVHGYYIEITKLNATKVPEHYIRRQTLKNNERYITPELKELEEKTLNAKSQSIEIEKEIFEKILATLQDNIDELSTIAHTIATLDILLSFATVADRQNYVKPKICADANIIIEEGRHPVVESIIDKPFVANSIDFTDKKTFIISGPNMGGKSTFMRQVALIAIMARIGSFVPAKSAQIGAIDRVFTRIGASDDLASGRSTFMVEMEEAANILNNASSQSLVIMDEVGRGTSTTEGAALASAIAQYICKKNKSLTLFSTHYSEITNLEQQFGSLENICFKAEEIKGKIVFLYHANKGAQQYSYGIEVGKLAGLPPEVINDAKREMSVLIQDSNARGHKTNNEALVDIKADNSESAPDTDEKTANETHIKSNTEQKQEKEQCYQDSNNINEIDTQKISDGGSATDAVEDSTYKNELTKNLFAIKDAIANVDINNLTPIAALNLIYELKQKI